MDTQPPATLQGSSAPPNPICQACAALDCSQIKNGKRIGSRCGLKTVSATHIGAIIAVTLAFTEPFLEAYGKFKHPQSGATPDVLPALFWLCFIATAIYYILSEWQTEDRQYVTLRNIKWRYTLFKNWGLERFPPTRLRWVELMIRVLLTCSFGAVLLLKHFGNRLHTWDVADLQMFAVCVIFWIFLAWDLLVIDGGGKKLSWPLVAADAVGFALVTAILWFHKNFDVGLFLAFIYFAAVLLLVFYSVFVKGKEFWFNRQSYR